MVNTGHDGTATEHGHPDEEDSSTDERGGKNEVYDVRSRWWTDAKEGKDANNEEDHRSNQDVDEHARIAVSRSLDRRIAATLLQLK